ncbi:MAG: hypothetical protein ACRCT1_01885 [Microcoleaceae cyanobacterium]
MRTLIMDAKAFYQYRDDLAKQCRDLLMKISQHPDASELLPKAHRLLQILAGYKQNRKRIR